MELSIAVPASKSGEHLLLKVRRVVCLEPLHRRRSVSCSKNGQNSNGGKHYPILIMSKRKKSKLIGSMNFCAARMDNVVASQATAAISQFAWTQRSGRVVKASKKIMDLFNYGADVLGWSNLNVGEWLTERLVSLTWLWLRLNRQCIIHFFNGSQATRSLWRIEAS